jgi:hypothetical protein
VSCSTTGEPAWLKIKSDIKCEDCTLRLGETVPHEVRFWNFGPLETRIDLTGTCSGPFLRYEGDTRSWPQQITVPRSRRRPGEATTSKGIGLPSGSAIGTQGTDEEVEAEVKKRRGKGSPQKASTLTLRVKLRH